MVNIVADGVLGDNDSWTAETSYRGISNYSNQRMAITGDAMKGLRAYLKFTQLRFHCSKKKGILSTSSPPLTAPVEKLSSAFSVLKQMSNHFLAIRLKG